MNNPLNDESEEARAKRKLLASWLEDRGPAVKAVFYAVVGVLIALPIVLKAC